MSNQSLFIICPPEREAEVRAVPLQGGWDGAVYSENGLVGWGVWESTMVPETLPALEVIPDVVVFDDWTERHDHGWQDVVTGEDA